jgi:hypothetical protein
MRRGSVKNDKSRQRYSEQPEVKALLMPIFAFLRNSGMTDPQLNNAIKTALIIAPKSRTKLKVVRQTESYSYSQLVDNWLKHPSYINASGQPLDLPLKGKIGFSGLMKLTGITHSPKSVISVLVRYGNVKRTASGTLRLVRRQMQFITEGIIPFEPNFAFLVDAATAATRGIGADGRQPAMFWIRAENTDIRLRDVGNFKAFAYERGRVFLHEIDDWLAQHAVDAPAASRNRKQLRRVGVGLFPFCTDR